MNATIIAAIITGCFTLLAALAVAYRDAIATVCTRSSFNVSGEWAGRTADLLVEEEFRPEEEHDYEIVGTFRQYGSMVVGKFLVSYQMPINIKITGHFVGECIVFHYKTLTDHMLLEGAGVAHVLRNGVDIRAYYFTTQMRGQGIDAMITDLKLVRR